MAKLCGLCQKRILSHSKVLKCNHCNCESHIKCYNLTENEASIIHDWFCKFCIYENIPFCNLEDTNEFQSAIYSLYSDDPLDFNELDKLTFNPFEWNQDTTTPMNELDPDLQYFSDPCYSNNYKCDYHLENSFNTFIRDTRTPWYFYSNAQYTKHFQARN